MAASSLRTLAILVLVAGTLICGGDVVSAQCGGSLSDLITQCFRFVRGLGPNTPPSTACCAEVTNFDVKCACNLVTQAIANLVNVPKAVFVAHSCGVDLPAGTNCGAITIPTSRR